MIPENTYTPLKADCPSAPCSASSCECAKCVGYRRYIDWKKMESKTSTPESRREFEEWLVDYYHESSTMKYDNGDYINVEAVVAWEAWQAARERQDDSVKAKEKNAMKAKLYTWSHSSDCWEHFGDYTSELEAEKAIVRMGYARKYCKIETY